MQQGHGQDVSQASLPVTGRRTTITGKDARDTGPQASSPATAGRRFCHGYVDGRDGRPPATVTGKDACDTGMPVIQDRRRPRLRLRVGGSATVTLTAGTAALRSGGLSTVALAAETAALQPRSQARRITGILACETGRRTTITGKDARDTGPQASHLRLSFLRQPGRLSSGPAACPQLPWRPRRPPSRHGHRQGCL